MPTDARDTISQKIDSCAESEKETGTSSLTNISHAEKKKIRQREYYAAHKDEINRKKAQYNAAHRDEINLNKAQYNAAHRDQINRKKAQYNAAHRDQINRKQAQYNAAHRDQINRKQAQYDDSHKKQIKQKKAKYYASHTDQISQNQAQYNKEHKADVSFRVQPKKRRAAKNAVRLTKRKRGNKKVVENVDSKKKYFARRQAIIKRMRMRLHAREIVDRILQNAAIDLDISELQLLSVVQKAFRSREMAITAFLKNTASFQEKIANMVQSLSELQEFTTEGCISAFCISGDMCHTRYSECYFYDTAYDCHLDNSFPLVIDEEGVVWNMIAKGEYKMNKKTNRPFLWPCYKNCNIRQETLRKISQFFLEVSRLESPDLLHYLCNLDVCRNDCKRFDRLGHPISCIARYCDCDSVIRLLNEAKCHFSELRPLTKDVYFLKGLAEATSNINNVINNSDDYYEFLKAIDEVRNRLRRSVDRADADNEVDSSISCSVKESDIFEAFGKQLAVSNKELNDFADTGCVSCERLCNASKLTPVANESLKVHFNNFSWLQLRALMVQKYGSETGDSLYICNYCLQKLKNDEIPCRSVLNNLQVDEMPLELNCLNVFEQILIQKIKAFQTVVRLGPVKAKLPASELVKGIKGRVVYLPLPLEENLAALPSAAMPEHDLHILVDGVPTKSGVIWQDIVNVKKVHIALCKLREINPLYKNVSLSLDEVKQYIIGRADDADANLQGAMIEKVQKGDETSIYQHYSIHPISSKHTVTNLEHYRMKRITGQSMNIWDKNLDLLAFPHMFPKGRFGKVAARPIPLSESEYRISRLWNKDSRFRLNPQYLFHLFYDSEIKSLSNSITFMLRMSKGNKCSVDQMLQKVEGNDAELESSLRSFFATMRGTKEYWGRRQAELLCMMREFGPPVWFVTLSCAEYDWENLYGHLQKVNSGVPNVKNMTPGQLCALDPVSVVTHYHTRFHAVLRNLILHKSNPVLGKISHFFWRVEYQCRSAPHVHMLLWSDDAPIIGKATNEEIANYILKYVTCSIPDENDSPQLHELVTKYQTHKCSAYCLRKKKRGISFVTQCKFGFPRAETAAFKLHDLHSSIRHRQKKKSTKRLYELPRNSTEVYINDYNPTLSFALKANVDVQYVGDESMAIARYVTSYISKQEKTEMDEVWNDICKDTLKSRLWSLGLKALTHRECGSYEIADRLLGTHLYGKSESILFINTHYPEKRNRVLKTFSELKELKENNPKSSDVYLPNLLTDLYPNRPDILENLSLYQFAKWYMRSSGERESEKVIVLKNNKGKMIRRNKPFLINHILHHPEKSEQENENYAHQMLLLFVPWRCEKELLGNYSTYAQAFKEHLPQTEEMLTYHTRLNKEKEMVKKNEEEFVKDTPLSVDRDDPENALPGFEEPVNIMQDVIDAMRVNNGCDLNANIQSLNDDQKRIFDKITTEILHQRQHDVNNSCTCVDFPKQILMFVSGVGGCGKSYLIQTIKQWMHDNFEGEGKGVSVAVCAPTGLAALNVSGLTVHRLLMLPVEHGKTADYKSLSPETKKVVSETLSQVKLLILDEVSMISSLLLTYIHSRLAEITENTEQPFGNINIVAFGDLLQLSPVKGNPPFMTLTREEIRWRLHALGAVDLWSLFVYDELTINVRQSSDPRYSNLLGNIRTGIVSPEDRELLKSRIFSGNSEDSVENAVECYNFVAARNQRPVCLLPTNEMCRKVNEFMLDNLGLHLISVKSIDIFDGPLRGDKAKACALEKLHENDQKSSMTAGLEAQLKLSLTARVMLRRNVDLSRGLVNGVVGNITDFDIRENTVNKIQIKFDHVGEPVWIERANVKFHLLKNVYVHRRQFPISLGYAITVHKSQGMSLDCAIIDIGPNTFAEGMSYVAVSRVTTLNGLYLLAFDEKKVVADIRAIQAYNDLRLRFRPDLGELPIGRTKKRPFRPSVLPTTPVAKKPRINISYVTRLSNPDSTMPVAVIPRTNTSTIAVKGFSNPDNVTCYANSSLQVLLSLPEFALAITQSTAQSALVNGLKDIINDRQIMDARLLSAVPIRHALGGIFIQKREQDVTDFIAQLIRHLEDDPNRLSFSEVFGHEIAYRKRCLQCRQESNLGQAHTVTTFFHLTFPKKTIREMGKVTWMDLQSWTTSDIKCNNCPNADVETKTLLLSCRKYLLVSLTRFENLEDDQGMNLVKIEDAVSGFNCKKIAIDGNHFETVAVVCHHGDAIKNGHYTSLIRTQSTWKVCNDSKISDRTNFIRELKDVYVLVLRKL